MFSIVTKDEKIGDEELDELDEQWSEIIDQLGESNVSDYIRYHHNSHRKMVTKNNLYTSMRKVITTPKKHTII